MAGRKPTTRRETERQSMYMRGVRARATLYTDWRIKTGNFSGSVWDIRIVNVEYLRYIRNS